MVSLRCGVQAEGPNEVSAYVSGYVNAILADKRALEN